MLKDKLAYTIIISFLFLSVNAFGQQAVQGATVVRGRTEATVNKPKVILSDIAEIKGSLNVSEIELMESPEPGESQTVLGETVVSKLISSGIDTAKIGYVFPNEIKVHRVGRDLNTDDIKTKIKDYIKLELGKSVEIDYLKVNDLKPVYDGEVKLGVDQVLDLEGGRFMISIESKHGEVTRREVFVKYREKRRAVRAKQAIARGDVISFETVALDDIFVNPDYNNLIADIAKIIGYEATRWIPKGHILARDDLRIAPIVRIGEKISLQYNSGRLFATASGVALDDGAAGAVIRVRNESSRKVVQGAVLESGIVGVSR